MSKLFRRSIRNICSIIIILIIIMPAAAPAAYQDYHSYAAEAVQAPGGDARSDSAEGFIAALGSGNASAATSTEAGRKVTTVTLKSDVVLSQALRIVPGSYNDMVVIDLAGHSLTGADASYSTDELDPRGISPIEISAGEFDVEIKGPGKVNGGKGAVKKGSMDGRNGGCAVLFVETPYIPYSDNARLEYGLSVTGGAELKGGDGADVNGALSSGSGGAGIGQLNAGALGYDSTLVYTRISIENGSVTGGNGGTCDMKGVIPTMYKSMNSSAVNDEVFSVGRGGDGIRVGCGRKYIFTGKESFVAGGRCGAADFGNYRTLNRFGKGFSNGDAGISVNSGDAGDGIAVWVSDLGITSVPVGYEGDGWKDKTKDSDDMGIYVEGTVTGGSSPDAKALNEDAGDGGSGIALYCDFDRYGIKENYDDWGIVDVEGTVTGGNGGSAVSGDPGNGGAGIYDSYSLDAEGDTMGDQGTNYYIINGTVKGGNGGSSLATTDFQLPGEKLSPALSGGGSYGLGGHGVYFNERYRAFVNLMGSGTAAAGDAGTETDRDSSDVSKSYADPIYLVNKDDPYYQNNVDLKTEEGALAKIVTTKRVDVTAKMSSFSSYPTKSTKLSCSVKKPSGYTGKVYVSWVCSIKLHGNDPDICVIEPDGTDATSFNLLSNKDYPGLAYEGYDYSVLGIHRYNMDLATTDRIKEVLKYQGSTCEIWCYVLLEDGSWGKSGVIRFDKNGWDGGAGDDEGDADRKAAAKVEALIKNIPAASSVTLSDQGKVDAARKAYDALTTEQKVLVSRDLVDALQAAEARIRELLQAPLDVIDMIERISDPAYIDENDPVEIADSREAITGALDAYNALSDEQKVYVDDFYYDLLIDMIAAFNRRFPDDPIGVPANEKIRITPEVILSSSSYTYSGKARKPGVTVKAAGNPIASSSYDVSYAGGRKAVGRYSVTVKLKGRYEGTGKASFRIIPKGASISKPKAAKRSLTVKWKAQKAKMNKKRISGYEVQASLKKNFKSGVKKKTLKGYKKKSVRISGLKSGKSYYVRVRTYMKTGGATYSSKWSKVKKIKVK